jgi:transcriptional regulator with XRE-family HTH domain
MKSKKTHAIDAMVGARIKNLRLRNKLSQSRLGEQIGVTYRQIHYYEKGTNRVSAARLAQLAKLFGVPVSAFYNEVTERNATPPTQQGTLRIVKAFEALKDHAQKVALIRLTQKLARHQQLFSDDK